MEWSGRNISDIFYEFDGTLLWAGKSCEAVPTRFGVIVVTIPRRPGRIGGCQLVTDSIHHQCSHVPI